MKTTKAGTAKTRKNKGPKQDLYLVPQPELSYMRSAYKAPPLPQGFVHDEALADYAFECLHITFSMEGNANYLICPHCGESYHNLQVKEQNAEHDFYGVVSGKCFRCKKSTELLSRLLVRGGPLKPHRLRCQCLGRRGFLFVHAKSATNGFFEEEVIASRCLDCGQLSVVLKGD
jgi:hypothetical protein